MNPDLKFRRLASKDKIVSPTQNWLDREIDFILRSYFQDARRLAEMTWPQSVCDLIRTVLMSIRGREDVLLSLHLHTDEVNKLVDVLRPSSSGHITLRQKRVLGDVLRGVRRRKMQIMIKKPSLYFPPMPTMKEVREAIDDMDADVSVSPPRDSLDSMECETSDEEIMKVESLDTYMM
ncbi:hypothetical protein EON63_12950 [archaeon]|nr:MAG: hypothetical protein EON63_12950 [archaeon]